LPGEGVGDAEDGPFGLIVEGGQGHIETMVIIRESRIGKGSSRRVVAPPRGQASWVEDKAAQEDRERPEVVKLDELVIAVHAARSLPIIVWADQDLVDHNATGDPGRQRGG
jgi:hypothetical protein